MTAFQGAMLCTVKSFPASHLLRVRCRYVAAAPPASGSVLAKQSTWPWRMSGYPARPQHIFSQTGSVTPPLRLHSLAHGDQCGADLAVGRPIRPLKANRHPISIIAFTGSLHDVPFSPTARPPVGCAVETGSSHQPDSRLGEAKRRDSMCVIVAQGLWT